MKTSKNENEAAIRGIVDKRSFIFGIMAVLLCGMGFGIIAPVVPFLVKPYILSPDEQARAVTFLTAIYALCVFLAAPGIGVLSDRYGRRPILLISLLGSATGYIIFGIGGALWVLFLGRIIEGFTGGIIGTLFAYFADITPKEERTKYFGWVSAAASVGVVIGPIAGGMLAKFGYSVPMFFGAIITLINFIYGYFYMPETLNKDNRLPEFTLKKLNPFTQLFSVLFMKNLTMLFLASFLIWVPNGSLQAILSQFSIDNFQLSPAVIGLMFSIIGVQDIISQGFIMPKLLTRLSDKKIAILGMTFEVFGYAFIGASAIFSRFPLFVVGMFLFAFGDSVFGPSFGGMISKSVAANEQGRVQGGNQAISSFARVVGPVLGGYLYITLGHSAPAFMGIILITAAIIVLACKARVNES